MALILPVNGKIPQFGSDCFLAPNSTITGDVTTGDRCSIWFGTVIRGDVNQILIGNDTNIQDLALIHGSFGKIPTKIGSRVTIGHQAMVHGCTIEDDVLIGMGAILLDNCVVGTGCIVGAGSLVLENTVLEPGFLYAGTPVRKIKPTTEAQKETINRTSMRYSLYGSWYNLPGDEDSIDKNHS